MQNNSYSWELKKKSDFFVFENVHLHDQLMRVSIRDFVRKIFLDKKILIFSYCYFVFKY